MGGQQVQGMHHPYMHACMQERVGNPDWRTYDTIPEEDKLLLLLVSH